MLCETIEDVHIFLEAIKECMNDNALNYGDVISQYNEIESGVDKAIDADKVDLINYYLNEYEFEDFKWYLNSVKG